MPWTAEPNWRTDKPERSTVALVQPGDGRDPDKDPFAQGPVLHLMSPAAARALAADLLRAADEVEPAAPAEPVGERSCFTCKHARGAECMNFDVNIGPYMDASGISESPYGMPTDRTIACPGHAPKVTT